MKFSSSFYLKFLVSWSFWLLNFVFKPQLVNDDYFSHPKKNQTNTETENPSKVHLIQVLINFVVLQIVFWITFFISKVRGDSVDKLGLRVRKKKRWNSWNNKRRLRFVHKVIDHSRSGKFDKFAETANLTNTIDQIRIAPRKFWSQSCGRFGTRRSLSHWRAQYTPSPFGQAVFVAPHSLPFSRFSFPFAYALRLACSSVQQVIFFQRIFLASRVSFPYSSVRSAFLHLFKLFSPTPCPSPFDPPAAFVPFILGYLLASLDFLPFFSSEDTSAPFEAPFFFLLF